MWFEAWHDETLWLIGLAISECNYGKARVCTIMDWHSYDHGILSFFSVMFNGERLEMLTPTRRIQQGDPISSYLDILSPMFLFTLRISFVLNQTSSILFKFKENNMNVYNKKCLLCENIFNDEYIVVALFAMLTIFLWS